MSTAAPALRRETRKAETRRALIEAASELFARQGIEATTLDAVAAHAGFTKGAVYAHFASKGDLVEEVLESASAVVDTGEMEDPKQSLEERFSNLGREAAEILGQIPRRSIILHVEYYLYVLRDPSRHRRSVRQAQRRRARDGATLEGVERERGKELLVPGSELVALLNAIGMGVVLELASDREVISPRTIELFFAALGRGLETNASAR